MNAFAFSQQRGLLASGSSDATIKIWNLDNKSHIIDLKGHKNGITSIAFNPDGKTLASCSIDKTIIIWNLETF